MALAPEQVGARIEKARKLRKLTHEQFARLMDVNLRTVQRWQKGRAPDGKSWLPRLETLMEIADRLEVPRSYFVEVEDVEPDQIEAGLAARVAALEGELEELRRRADREAAEQGPARRRHR